jgi:hypothetical protein
MAKEFRRQTNLQTKMLHENNVEHKNKNYNLAPILKVLFRNWFPLNGNKPMYIQAKPLHSIATKKLQVGYEKCL